MPVRINDAFQCRTGLMMYFWNSGSLENNFNNKMGIQEGNRQTGFQQQPRRRWHANTSMHFYMSGNVLDMNISSTIRTAMQEGSQQAGFAYIFWNRYRHGALIKSKLAMQERPQQVGFQEQSGRRWRGQCPQARHLRRRHLPPAGPPVTHCLQPVPDRLSQVLPAFPPLSASIACPCGRGGGGFPLYTQC